MVEKPDAILILTFGGPEKPEDVMPFLRNVTAGRNVPTERLAIVAEQYAHFGGRSPINDLSRELVEALKVELVSFGHNLPVYWGTRNWDPYLSETVMQMADDGIKNAVVFSDSPYSSYSSCRQYEENLEAAAATVAASGKTPPRLTRLRSFFNHPGFIDVMAQHTMAAINQHPGRAAGDRGAAVNAGAKSKNTRLIFTAHSIPLGMAAACDYEKQLNEAAALVVERLGPDRPTNFDLVFQSRSSPVHVPWLEPDICDYLRSLDTDEPVTIVPIGFTQEHTEILYDLDMQASDVATERAISMTRAKTVGSHHMYIKMIRELIEEQLIGGAALAIGSMGVSTAHHGPDHCASGAKRPTPKDGHG